MNYGISYNPNIDPGNNATDSRYLFNTLGYFWHRLFGDRQAVEGLTMGQSAAAEQAYTDLMGMIDSYSCLDIPIFESRNWYPLIIHESDLDNNTLLFGEGVKLGDTVDGDPYIFGDPIPNETECCSIIMPKELKDIGLIVDHIIAPTVVLTKDDENYWTTEYRLFFKNNPFEISALTKHKEYNTDGSDKNDDYIILWCYNASIDSENLKYSIGYLFGLNVPHTAAGKGILSNMIKLYTKGPTINDIKAIALACIGLPIITERSTVSQAPAITDGYHVITTDKGIFRYPAEYKLKTGITTNTVLKIGDVPVEAVELLDRMTNEDWWTTELGVSIETPGSHNRTACLPRQSLSDPETCLEDPENKAFVLTTVTGRALYPLVLPNCMMLSSCRHNLTFSNDVEPITMDLNENIVFPVTGDKDDVTAFQEAINDDIIEDNEGLTNKTKLLYALNDILTPSLSLSNPLNFINPVDFMFNLFMKNTTAILRIKFLNIKQLANFENYFKPVSETLPSHIILLILCDIHIPDEVMELNSTLNTDTPETRHPLIRMTEETMEHVTLNSGSGLLAADMTFSRVPKENPTTEQYSLNLVITT
jgi:hypothetical protein